ncbi:helix-turn-helix domain-containing protein [Orrella sp. 11846]|uniref:helix-turn-helix domain-containing protein n=1 Tax=Orrella sp. 11846 TaxID=3409913 RepID=UPI003B5AE968
MSESSKLPYETWSEALTQARVEQSLSIEDLSRELLLSIAQLRGIEAGNGNAFHGDYYYLRGVAKYADRLSVELEPSVQSFLDAKEDRIGPNTSMTQMAHVASGSLSAATSNSLGVARSSGFAKLGILILLLLIILGVVYIVSDKDWFSSETVSELVQDAQELTDFSPEAPSPSPSLSEEQSQTLVTDAEPFDNSVIEPVDPESIVSNPRETDQSLINLNTQRDTLVLTFTGECWAEVRRQNGDTTQKIYQNGDSLSLKVDEIGQIVLGNLTHVQAKLDDKPLDLSKYTSGSGGVARLSGQALSEQIR